MLAPLQPTTETGWCARLALDFQHNGHRSVLKRCRHSGPLRVQRAFYPDADETCHVYILHPPGGVVGGDSLHFNGQLDCDSQVLLTTPAAGKFYRSAGPSAIQTHQLTVQPGAAVEWLPQETIVFDGAKLAMTTRLDLHGDARAIGWEIICLGRPAAHEVFTHGSCRLGLEIYRDGQALLIEHSVWQGGSALLNAPWGLNGQSVCGTFFATVHDSALSARLRDAIQVLPPARFATTQLQGDLLLCRYLGPSSAEARDVFARVWALLRPDLLHKPATPPRIWAV
jgi:urease accessory protein